MSGRRGKCWVSLEDFGSWSSVILFNGEVSFLGLVCGHCPVEAGPEDRGEREIGEIV